MLGSKGIVFRAGLVHLRGARAYSLFPRKPRPGFWR